MTLQKKIEKKFKKILISIAKIFFSQQKRELISYYDRILIIRQGGLGDMILSIPVIKLIRNKYPNAKIDLLCEPNNVLPAKGLGLINGFYIFYKNPLKLFKLVRNLQNNKYQFVLNLNGYPSFTYGLLGRIVALEAIRVGGDQRDYSFFFNHIIDLPLQHNQHMLERLFQLGSSIISEDYKNLKTPWFNYSVEINDKAEKIFNELLSELNTNVSKPKIVLINLSAGNKEREWPIEKYVNFLEIVNTKYSSIIDGWAILSNPKDLSRVARIFESFNSNKIVFIPPQNDFRIIIALLKNIFFLFTPDTSLAHAGSAMGCPVVDLIHRGNLITWSPIGVKNRVVFPSENHDMNSLEVNDVLNNLESIITELTLSA